jgi:TonB-linked SusC/RagA family outer membrane protein
MKKTHTILIAVFSIVFALNVQAQEKRVSGVVTSKSDGTLLPGVSIAVQGTTRGTETDFDGKYTIKTSVGEILNFSFLGMKTKTVTIGSSNTLNIALEDDADQLDEIVVTALGISREKKSLGYSISDLGGKEVSLAKETNVVNSLSGKVAGVVITQSASGPAGGTRVIIRGNNSISGNNQPLYVVDGVPVDNSGIGSANGDSTSEFRRDDLGTGISDINPDDIASISILKGPNAAALYGSRASNGVILITTKKGGSGKGLGISFSSNVSIQSPLLLPKYQNEYGRGVNGAFAADLNQLKSSGSWGPKFDGSQQSYYTGENRVYSAKPNNVKNFFVTGSNVVNTVAISKSSENSSLRFSYTNSEISSILPNSTVKRNNFNLRGFSKITDKLTLDAKVTYFLQDVKNRASQGTEGIMAYLYGLGRNIDINDLKNYQDIPNNGYGVIAPTNGGGNPYWILNQDKNADSRRRLTGFAKAQYDFNSKFKAFVRVGTDVVDHQTERVQAIGHHFRPLGTLEYTTSDFTETNYDFLLMYNDDINEDFNLSANFGGNALHSTAKFSSLFGEEFKIPGKHFIANTNSDRLRVNQTELIERKVNSLYGSASLAYKNMAYLDLTGRNDWSSALASNNRSYFYSSASLSLLLNKIFKIESEKINFTKLRFSYANVGNDTGANQLVNLYSIAANGFLNQISVSKPTIRLSNSLRPEDVTSTEIGFEIKAFQNRLFADFTYYSINSKDLIFDVPLGVGAGFDFSRENVGELTNKGFEFLIGGSPIKKDNFEWTISANVAANKNKLVSLIEGQDLFQFTSSNNGIVDVRAQVGDGYGDIYGTDWERTPDGNLLLTATGLPQASTERVKLGNSQPDFTGGITNTFNYKNFSLNFLVDFRVGGQVFSATDAALDASGVSRRSLKYREGGITLDGVFDNNGALEPNTTNITAQEYWGAVSNIASEYVYDQTNARLRELSISYRFSPKILDRTFINAASISLTGRNLFFLYKKSDNFDPEASYSTSNFAQGVQYYNLPTTSSVGLNLNIKF